jgi:2-phosphoglycerate kinase
MHNGNTKKLNFELPKGFIVFISGVPGVGKTTISYELLKMFDEFRIVEETDLIREVLRGYNDYIKDTFKDKSLLLFEELEISHHTKFLRYQEAKKQCNYMRKSFEKIISRQKRKGITTIINGVHIVP